MLEKYRKIQKIIDSGIVAVIRGKDKEDGIRVSEACIEGGITALEITYTVAGASEIIKFLKENNENEKIIIGAGSILDPHTSRTAILAGAEYIVSPGFNKEVAKICNLYHIPYMPGCMTITEITTALEYGVDIIKLFPGNSFDPSFIKSIKAPLPNINVMPTGGVSLENIEDWFQYGASVVGAGGKLASGSTESIIETAKKFVEKINKIKNK